MKTQKAEPSSAETEALHASLLLRTVCASALLVTVLSNVTDALRKEPKAGKPSFFLACDFGLLHWVRHGGRVLLWWECAPGAPYILLGQE